MSILLIQLPARPHQDEASPLRAPSAWHYVWSGNGQRADRSGVAATDLLPKADSVVAVVAASDLSWQRITLPRASAGRLRVALLGVLEEQLLEDADTLHVALAPKAEPGALTWVAVTHRPWMQCLLRALEASGRSVERLLPPLQPDAAGSVLRGHFHVPAASELADEVAADAAHALPWVDLSSAAGCCHLALTGGLAAQVVRGMLDPAATATSNWTASPAAAAAAEAWLQQHGFDARVSLLSDAEHGLAALASPWNLRQFELVPQQRGMRALRDVWRRLRSPAARPLRWGLAALVVFQLVGLNARAWQQERQLRAKRAEVDAVLRAAHPQVRAVLDAPAQMLRETELLRVAAGRAGPGDLEVQLAAAAQGWPDGLAAAQNLRFENGQLQIGVPGATEAHAASLRDRLKGLGLDARLNDSRLVVQRVAQVR